MKESTTLLIAGLLLFLLANFADYQLQAEQHGWNGLLWERYERAPHWPDPFDAIPHDAWHVAQTIRNTFDKIAAVMIFGAAWLFAEDWMKRRYPFVWLWGVGFIAMFAVYAITRGIAFSLVYRVLN